MPTLDELLNSPRVGANSLSKAHIRAQKQASRAVLLGGRPVLVPSSGSLGSARGGSGSQQENFQHRYLAPLTSR